MVPQRGDEVTGPFVRNGDVHRIGSPRFHGGERRAQPGGGVEAGRGGFKFGYDRLVWARVVIGESVEHLGEVVELVAEIDALLSDEIEAIVGDVHGIVKAGVNGVMEAVDVFGGQVGEQFQGSEVRGEPANVVGFVSYIRWGDHEWSVLYYMYSPGGMILATSSSGTSTTSGSSTGPGFSLLPILRSGSPCS